MFGTWRVHGCPLPNFARVFRTMGQPPSAKRCDRPRPGGGEETSAWPSPVSAGPSGKTTPGKRVGRKARAPTSAGKAVKGRTAGELRRLGPAINASLDAIYVLAAVRDRRGRIVDFRIVDLNARCLRLLGARRALLVDALVSQALPKVRTNGFFEQYVQVATTGRPRESCVAIDPPWTYAKWKERKYLHYQIMRLDDGVLVTVRDVTMQKRAELELRALPRFISEAQEQERRRVARELHDGVSQLLVSARYRLREAERLARTAPAPVLLEHVTRAEHALELAAREVRRISHALRPRELDDIGLVAAISRLAEDFQERTGVATRYRARQVGDDLPAPVAEALYRITQEALTNIERHAGARRVAVQLRATAERLRLSIADDGRGVGRTRRAGGGGLGLLHMRERAEALTGTMCLRPRRGRGTEIVVEVPLRIRQNGA